MDHSFTFRGDGRLPGYGRVGRKLKRRIGTTVDACIANERLVERDGTLYVAK